MKCTKRQTFPPGCPSQILYEQLQSAVGDRGDKDEEGKAPSPEEGTDSGRERGDGGKREWARQSTRAALQQTQDILTGPLTGTRGAGRAAGRAVVGAVATIKVGFSLCLDILSLASSSTCVQHCLNVALLNCVSLFHFFF